MLAMANRTMPNETVSSFTVRMQAGALEKTKVARRATRRACRGVKLISMGRAYLARWECLLSLAWAKNLAWDRFLERGGVGEMATGL